MSPIILDENQINRLLDKIDVQQALRDMFYQLADSSAVQPPQSLTLFPNNQGDFITYQGVLETSRTFGVKIYPYIQNNRQPVTAWACLMAMENGPPLRL